MALQSMRRYLKSDQAIAMQEERQFTNPHIRFRRINGRIVPIINRKRIGLDLTSSGRSIGTVGLGITSVGGGIYLGKKRISKIFKNSKGSEKFAKLKKSISASQGAVTYKKISGKFGIRHIRKLGKFILKHPTKIGLVTMGLGAASYMVGTELEAQSPFGKDFFFIKDEQGRG